MGQIFVYKLYTFFDGCYASVLPLQHFTFVLKQIVLTTMKRMLNRMLRSIRFAANAENIRTKEHKNKRASRHTDMDLRPCALKNRRATPLRPWTS